MSRDADRFAIATLGEPAHASPLNLSTIDGDSIANYTPDGARLPHDPLTAPGTAAFELAGPRQKVFFKGDEVTAGIVTCGGLCPGMNNVIRGLVNTLSRQYGVRRIYGFRYGFRGMAAFTPSPPVELDPQAVSSIHLEGGTVLGSSRGPQQTGEMVDTLQRLGINAFFCIGGDGSMRGAEKIYGEVCARGAQIAIIGVPKTIDNDIPMIERTFGFETAVALAAEAIHAAHVEAMGAPNGLGIVKLMGRHSGFIAASAATAARVADLVLVPELPFTLDGERGVFAYLTKRIETDGHAVMVVAEGAGQHYVSQRDETDASGNKRLGDIGIYLRDACKKELAAIHPTVKYIDPSYIIRARPAVAGDAIFCGRLAEDAVHAAMAGKTGMVVGLWLGKSTHVPLAAATSGQKTISLDSPFWRSVLDATHQPPLLG